jgi:ABC-type multidrug transport system fused ATPase/permease subunit
VTRFVHPLSLLAVIAVPIVGWFFEDWSGPTTLAVYWFENVAVCVFIVARILLHQRWSPRSGHFRYTAPSADRRSSGNSSSFVTGFAVTSFAFCAAHAVFLAAIVFLLNRNGEGRLADVDWRSVGFGCLSVLAFLALDFFADLFSLRRWSFWQLEQTAQRGLSRVVVVHLTLIFGFIGIALTDSPSAFFGVFVVLKTLASLSAVLPQWEPKTPPKWFSNIMNRVPNVRPGERFEDFWAEDRADEAERRERNERPWTARRR